MKKIPVIQFAALAAKIVLRIRTISSSSLGLAPSVCIHISATTPHSSFHSLSVYALSPALILQYRLRWERLFAFLHRYRWLQQLLYPSTSFHISAHDGDDIANLIFPGSTNIFGAEFSAFDQIGFYQFPGKMPNELICISFLNYKNHPMGGFHPMWWTRIPISSGICVDFLKYFLFVMLFAFTLTSHINH